MGVFSGWEESLLYLFLQRIYLLRGYYINSRVGLPHAEKGEAFLWGKESFKRRVQTTTFCAYIYPASVNNKPGKFYDGFANDQDWALVFYMEVGGDKNCNQQVMCTVILLSGNVKVTVFLNGRTTR